MKIGKYTYYPLNVILYSQKVWWRIKYSTAPSCLMYNHAEKATL